MTKVALDTLRLDRRSQAKRIWNNVLSFAKRELERDDEDGPIEVVVRVRIRRQRHKQRDRSVFDSVANLANRKVDLNLASEIAARTGWVLVKVAEIKTFRFVDRTQMVVFECSEGVRFPYESAYDVVAAERNMTARNVKRIYLAARGKRGLQKQSA
ncbi:hypothetical protein [Bradyrhizobium sp. CCBAU 11357]|uniref:hypothetical protein n=1 Tax=Bradyrhizobium sp. CCBAU 11357 TaxID=1630808 RepID=UPI0023043A31|nr:hypothetical protein [Bradyrhizobium sp. CCBAU 11357]